MSVVPKRVCSLQVGVESSATVGMYVAPPTILLWGEEQEKKGTAPLSTKKTLLENNHT
jgi:hypothetical protein